MDSEIGHGPFQSGSFGFQFVQPFCLVYPHLTVALAPAVVGRVSYPDLFINLADSIPLPQQPEQFRILRLCKASLRLNGYVVVYGHNGANPMVGWLRYTDVGKVDLNTRTLDADTL